MRLSNIYQKDWGSNLTLRGSNPPPILYTFLSIMFNLYADDNGTTSWVKCLNEALNYNLVSQFLRDYSHLRGEKIDVGEFYLWIFTAD